MGMRENDEWETIDPQREIKKKTTDLQKFAELLQQFDDIQKQINSFVDGGQKELERFRSKLDRMDTRKADTAEVKRLGDQLQTVSTHLGTMENGLLAEFRVSQSLMRNMIEHDMNAESQKLALQLEMDRKKSDIETALFEQQNQMEIERQKERAAFKKKLVLQIAGILGPILIAATAAVIKIIEAL